MGCPHLVSTFGVNFGCQHLGVNILCQHWVSTLGVNICRQKLRSTVIVVVMKYSYSFCNEESFCHENRCFLNKHASLTTQSIL